jgi:hypothetical protein
MNTNFISVDKKTVINSNGDFFSIGETVKHQDPDAEKATIINFEPNTEINEIKVITNKGYAYIDFLIKIEE